VLNILKLLRPLNLSIIALTMYLLHYAVTIEGIEQYNNVLKYNSSFDFFLLVLSTILIAASGNIINDYFDLKADRINKPEKVIVGKYLPRRIAMAVHIFLNIIGVLIGIFLSFKYDFWWILLIHVISITILWFYSIWFKRILLIGNFAIAFVTALVPVLVGIFDLNVLICDYPNVFQWSSLINKNDDLFILLFLGYALFAFLATLIREIQKDMADVKGDRSAGSNTFPVIYGKKKSKGLVVSMIFVKIFLVFLISLYFLKQFYAITYFSILIVIPLVISAWVTFKADERKKNLKLHLKILWIS
ncbi:MAG: geranylgeranylglycerol-phosphate geranylgeranyltransferase, partial [Flavobacteriales bacterium]